MSQAAGGTGAAACTLAGEGPAGLCAVITVGWHEWVALPCLGIDHMIAKVDTGARTSALHAVEIDRDYTRGAPIVQLKVHTDRHHPDRYVIAEAAVVDSRRVKSSTGNSQRRLVIASELVLGGERWPIELSITDRKKMGFRMLLGRRAMAGRLLVDPSASFLLGGNIRTPGPGIHPVQEPSK